MELMHDFLSKIRKRKLKIHCVGDAMIDEYYKGHVNRISPEFPMSVMTSDDDKPIRRPGGAANVAHQFRHFNADAWLVAYTDAVLKSVLKEHDIKHAECPNISYYGGRVPVKKRFWHDTVQVHRWDIEKPLYGMADKWLDGLEPMVIENWLKLPAPDVVVLSDYDKGVFSDARFWMDYASSLGVPTIVDPKRGPASRWRRCTVFKPNAKEARDISGKRDWKDQCHHFVAETDCDHVVITCGGDGVKGWSRDVSTGFNTRLETGEFWEFTPDSTVKVESVIGAGDCFVAMLALAVGHGFYMKNACEIAFRAGAVYVQNNMNRPIVPGELAADKIVEPEDLASRDFKLVFTNGCFDILHAGHLRTLTEAKKRGDKLVVALNTDASVKRLKGESRPVNCLANRLEVMSHLGVVDYVMFFDEDTPLEVIKRCQPDVLVKGGDYQIENIVGHDIVKEVYTVPVVEGLSTTAILQKGQ